jgi:hypothetical protein
MPHEIDWPRLWLFPHQKLLLLQVRASQQQWAVMIHCFRVRVELQPLRWKEVQCKTLLIDGMEMLMALVVDPNPSPYLLENFLQQVLLWKLEKMDSIMMLKEYGTGLYQALVVQIIEFCIKRLQQLRKTMDMQ